MKTLNEMITLVSNNIANRKEIGLDSGLYTEESILNLLQNIESPMAKFSLPPNWVSECAERLVDHLENDFDEFVDYDDVEFELDHNTISLQSVGMNTRGTRRNIEMFLAEEVELMEEAYSGTPQEHEVFTNDENCIS